MYILIICSWCYSATAVLAGQTPMTNHQCYFTFYVVTYFTRTLDLQMKRESASSNKEKIRNKEDDGEARTRGSEKTGWVTKKSTCGIWADGSECRGSRRISQWGRPSMNFYKIQNTVKKRKKMSKQTNRSEWQQERRRNATTRRTTSSFRRIVRTFFHVFLFGS